MDYEADPVNGHYNDSNRAFIQALLARGTITIAEGKKLLADIFAVHEGKETDEDEVTQEDLDSYIAAAADAVSPFDYEIRNTQHQTTKKRIYALVNSSSDPLTQFATTKTPEEIAYVKRFLDAMFETYNRPSKEIMAVSGMQSTQGALRKGAGIVSMGDDTQSVDKGVTVEQTERLLGRMVKEEWLERSKAGYYSLAPRALMELRSWLVETYNDADEPDEWQKIKFCEACKEIITAGQRCARGECHVRLHTICEAAYWNSRPAKKCPKCHTVWSGNKFVGEKVITTTEEYLKGKRRSGGGKRAREEPEEAEEEEEPAPSRQRNGRATQAAVDEEEGEDTQPARRRGGAGTAVQQAASDSEEEDE